jgi:hypothetical protein
MELDTEHTVTCQKMSSRTKNVVKTDKDKKLQGKLVFMKYMFLWFTGRQTDKDTHRIRLKNVGNSDIWNTEKMDINRGLVLHFFCFISPCQFTPLLNFRRLIFGLMPFVWFICNFYLRLSHLCPFFEDQNSDVKQWLCVQLLLVF